MYMKRTIEQTIMEATGSFPCIVIYGPRQTGKSTTIHHLFGGKYPTVTLDDAEDRQLAKNNPKLFLEHYQWPLVIDEIQKAPELFDEIKKKIGEQKLKWLDSGENRSLMYILTRSNRFELQESVADSLAGRCAVIDMASFSAAEKYGYETTEFHPDIISLKEREHGDRKYKSRREVFEDIFMGGYPDICTGVAQRDYFYRSYVNTYIEKDVMKLINASSEMQFRNFISIVALRTAQELHYDEIAGSVGIDVRTCKRWISILQSSGIIYLLQPYMAKISNRIIKAPKLYFMDTGLCAYLCKWPDAEMLEKCAMSGAFFETWVVSEMIKNLTAYNKDPKEYLFYYRDIDQKKIDLIYIDAAGIYPIEIKKGIMPTKPAKNFSVLQKYKQTIQPGLIIDTCGKIRPLNEHVYSFPVYLL